MAGKNGSFNGFSPEATDFLISLGQNNNKDWFEANKGRYQEFLLDPLKSMVSDLAPLMISIDPHLEVRPARAVSRIYRDTRFSRDKSPYKTAMWIAFKRPVKNWQDAPAYFFEICGDSYRYGMGFYSAEKKTMDKFREMIDARPQEFLEAVSFYRQQDIFTLEGDLYKKILNNNIPEEIQNWYQRKSFYLLCDRAADQRLFSRGLIDDLLYGFELVAPLYHYLWKIKEMPNQTSPVPG